MALDDREITYEGVTFSIGKLLPMESKKFFMEHVRPMLEGAMSASADRGLTGMILGVLSKAPQQHYDALVAVLYPQITYRTADMPNPMPLARDEANAFKDLDMAHILMLDVRAFAVNFRGSWDVLQSEFPQLRLLIQASTPETSIPSSITP